MPNLLLGMKISSILRFYKSTLSILNLVDSTLLTISTALSTATSAFRHSRADLHGRCREMRPRLANQVHPLPTPHQPRVHDRLVTVQPLLHPRFVAGACCTTFVALLSAHSSQCTILVVPCILRYSQCPAPSLRYSLRALLFSRCASVAARPSLAANGGGGLTLPMAFDRW
jgi:hypothetical protein